jgi:hypothetical protein
MLKCALQNTQPITEQRRPNQNLRSFAHNPKTTINLLNKFSSTVSNKVSISNVDDFFSDSSEDSSSLSNIESDNEINTDQQVGSDYEHGSDHEHEDEINTDHQVVTDDEHGTDIENSADDDDINLAEDSSSQSDSDSEIFDLTNIMSHTLTGHQSLQGNFYQNSTYVNLKLRLLRYVIFNVRQY